MTDPCTLVSGADVIQVEADYYMEVAGFPIQFVAKLPATLQPWGPHFATVATQAAWRRAASTLAQMGLVRGYAMLFLRLGVPWQQSDVASFLGVSVPQVQAWEAETEEVPPSVWVALATYVAGLDGRYSFHGGQFCPPGAGYQPRVIRVHPDIPQTPMQQQPDPCPPCPC